MRDSLMLLWAVGCLDSTITLILGLTLYLIWPSIQYPLKFSNPLTLRTFVSSTEAKLHLQNISHSVFLSTSWSQLTCSSPCDTGAAVAAASAASSSSYGLGTSLDPHQHCWLAQSPQQRRSRPRCRPQTCWSLQSGTDGRCWSPLKAWREMSRSSYADVVSPRHSHRCGKPRCWTGRLQTELVEACRWRRQLTGSWCCPVDLSVQTTGVWEESKGVSALRSGPGSCWVRLARLLGLPLGCCTERGQNNIWKVLMTMWGH